MGAILQQFGLDKTFYVEFGIFFVLFSLLSRIYFKPFLALFKARHERTIEDRRAADDLAETAHAKLQEYQKKLGEYRADIRKAHETLLLEARKEESAILTHAREQAKKITHEAAESVNQQREQLKNQMEIDVEGLARSLSERLLSRKV